MKKIYMILAAMTLLSMSLNAQTVKATKNGKVMTPKSLTEKKADMSQPGIINNTSHQAPAHAPMRADRATQTWSWVGDEDGTNLPSGWSLSVSNTALNDNGDGTWYIGGQVANRGITIDASVFTGYTNITVIVRGKIDTGYSGKSVTVNGDSKTLTNTLANYTWNNVDASSGIVIGVTDGYVGLSSITITGESSSSSSTTSQPICDGTTTNEFLPIYGFYNDDYQINQMIYPESLLSEISGKTLTSMTFYANGNLGTNLGSSVWTVKLGTTTQTTFASSLSSITRLVPTDVTIVAQGYSITTGINTMTINFTTPFTYNGDNLLIDFQSTTDGGWVHTYFYGVDQSSITGYNSYNSSSTVGSNGHYSSGDVRQFLPKVTFTYEEPVNQHDLAIALSAPATAGAGSTIDVTATVTNNGDFAENGYTVTVTDGTNIVNITAQEELGIGETATFTVQFTTSTNAAGQTVNYTATVACTDDAVATNNTATASTSLLACPPPENVAATGSGQSGTMTWDAPTITPPTVNEGFDDTSVFPSLSIGGITATVHTGTIGGWTVYTPSGDYVYAPQNASFTNMQAPQAWTVMNPTAANWNIDTPHSGSQFMVSFCDSGDENFQNIQTTNHWLISPELSGAIQTITFWERVITTQYGDETYEVLASSTDNNPSSFSVVQSFTSDATTWTQRQVTLPAGTKYFAIKHTSYDIFGVMIDDVTYVAAPVSPISYNIYLDGVLIDNVPSTTFSYTFNNVSTGQHQCAVSAVYSYGESVAVPATFNTKLTPNAPTVSSVDGTTSTTITITPDPNTDGQLSYYVIDQNGQQTQNLEFPRGETDYVVTVHAYTTATSNYNESPEAVIPVTIPALPQTPAPTIAISSQTDDEVTITATGNGTVILNIPGYPQATGNGSASITVPRHMADYVVTATATAQASGELVSTTTTQNITVPGKGNDGWTQMTGTYNNPNDLLSFKVKVGNDTTDIMMIDQFLQSTVFNNHPSSYTYVLKETKVINGVDSTMTSNPATIPVYKTNSTMRGLYTEAQVLADDYADEANRLTANAVNGEMDYDVVPDNNVLYYSLYRGGIQEQTPVVDVDHRISQLQKFEDKVGDNVTYYLTENHPTGILPRYDHEDNIGSQIVERLDVDYVTGETHDQMSYVPVIWTFGLYTARGDGKNNSYGSDIKYNELGGVNVSSDIIVNWSDNNKMKVNGVDYYVVSPVITLDAVAPELGASNDGETYKYVPYMYRVWCTYTDAHSFGHVVNPDGINYSLVETGLIDAPFLIGEVKADTISDDPTHIVIGRDLGHVSPQTQWSFAVTQEAALNNDIKFVVRYYYKKVVTEPASPDQPAGMRGNRDGGADYAIYEKSTSSSDIVTGVNELWSGYGKVVISQTYVNAQGMQSDKPFDGLNIVVTRFSDGTTTTTKVVR